METTKSLEVKQKAVKFPITLSVKMDWETFKEIQTIGLFEKKKPSTFARDELVNRVHTYLRNPQYLRFKRDLTKLKEEDTREERS